MQPHEGPRRDPRAHEREQRRQRVLTGWLVLAILVLVALIAAIWVWR